MKSQEDLIKKQEAMYEVNRLLEAKMVYKGLKDIEIYSVWQLHYIYFFFPFISFL